MEQWYDFFLRDPQQAVADLFGGRAGLGSSLRLDIPELLYQEFPDMPEYAEPRQVLDNALWHWLSTMHRDYAAQVERLQYGVYSKRLCDALISVHLLDLPNTNYHLRKNLTNWLNWLTPLRLASERDPALECWRVLTRRQADNASPAPWLQLATDSRLEYFSVAMVGLQRLPNNHNAQRNQQMQLLALLQHVSLFSDSNQAYKFFNQQYAALQAIYPAAPDHWQNLLITVTEGFKHKAQSSVAEELLEKLRQPSKPQRRQRKTSPVAIQPADETEYVALLKDIENLRRTAEALAERVFSLLNKNYAYAQATGDSYDFVHSLSQLSTNLLKRHKLSASALNRLQIMIERGLFLEPMNPYMWMLWKDYLTISRHSEAQEWVLREAVRLFPDNEPCRVELARLLSRQGNDKEAERWLREAAERNPNREPCRVELARLLSRQGNDKEAERWLREAADRNPNHEPSRVVLAHLLVRQGKAPKAEELLTKFLKHNPQKSRAREVLADIQNGIIDASTELDFGTYDAVDYEAQNGIIDASTELNFGTYDAIDYKAQNGIIDASTELDFGTNDAVDHEAQSSSALGKNQQVINSPPAKRTKAELPTRIDALSDLLNEIKRRALLHNEFTNALILPEYDVDNISREAAQGDAIACFYKQWLTPQEALNTPPHAWAARACQLYQTQASEADWKHLNQIFPEQHSANQFLHLQIVQDKQKAAALLDKLSSNAKSLTPLQKFMCQTLEANNTIDKDNVALAILASAAANAPQFVTC